MGRLRIFKHKAESRMETVPEHTPSAVTWKHHYSGQGDFEAAYLYKSHRCLMKKDAPSTVASTQVPEQKVPKQRKVPEQKVPEQKVPEQKVPEETTPEMPAPPSPRSSDEWTLPTEVMDTQAEGATLAHQRLGAPAEPVLDPRSEEWKLHQPGECVDPKDVNTPDGWIPRNKHLIRHTGKHPLNCEAPMDRLMDAGFITPAALHFVRSHGAVPKLNWNTHRIEINGLVERPMRFSMDELIKFFPSVTIPVTLSCAGNRRKEVMMTDKTIGFHWGPCATSCTYWTGVRLSDVLRHVGAYSHEQGARHVCYRGPKNELPKGSDGSYGTSIKLAQALKPTEDVLIAYKQNGRYLAPDHGFPVRMIVPGNTSGRMVKWLSEITVTDKESDNFYHYHDNRLFPPHVNPELCDKEGWWFKPDFIINETNIQSAIAQPGHDEVISLSKNAPCTVKGYAYSGGGRKIIRVELSLDDGKTWRQANINTRAEPNPAGRHWCWVHWDLDIPRFDLLGTEELIVRAVDAAQNTQPLYITWNMLGMMNNCCYRIRIHKHLDANDIGLRFQHPAPPVVGPLGNVGWREEEYLKKEALEAPVAPAKPAQAAGGKTYTMDEVAKHNTEESAWFVHEGKVYDATPFLEDHPGGAESILIATGIDATEDFNAIHSKKATQMLADYYIGDLVESNAAQPAPRAVQPALTVAKPAPVVTAQPPPRAVQPAPTAAQPAPVALNPRQKIPFRLIERFELSHDTRLLRFALQSPQHKLGLPVGKHMFFYANIDGEPVMRAYTPTSSDDDLGHFDLVVKVYFENQHKDFPEGGKMSQHLDKMQIGDTIDVKGPVGHFVYESQGTYSKNRKPGKARYISMIGAGSGITPLYQVIKAILKNPEDKTQIRLLFANRLEQDILLRSELDKLAKRHSNFKVGYTLTQPPSGWKHSTGRVSKQMLAQHLFAGGEDTIALMCGPQGLIDVACKPNLSELGYGKDSMVVF